MVRKSVRELEHISCPACEKFDHPHSIHAHIHAKDDRVHNELANNIEDVLGDHPLTINDPSTRKRETV